MVLYLSTMFFHTGTNRTEGTKCAQYTCTHTHLCTYTHVSETEAEIFPTATRRATNAHPARGRHAASPSKGRRTLRYMQAGCYTHSCTEPSSWPDTPAHQPIPCPPAHTAVLEQFPRTGSWCSAKTKTFLKLKMERLHWGEKKQGKEGISCYILLGDFCFYDFFIFYFFWQTRIPFELIHFFLPRISNDNA